MSLNKETREAAKYYLLEQIESQNSSYVQKTVDAFGITRGAVYSYLRNMEEEGILKHENRKYILSEQSAQFKYDRSKSLEETEIYEKDLMSFFEDMDDNIQSMWEYSISEMLNNAIDHSEAHEIIITVVKNYLYTSVSIYDDGVGIFRKIKDYYEYDSLDTAIVELFKGKLTTDQDNHSGEGIFFTSRIMDIFGAFSDGKVFSHNNYRDVFASVEDKDFPSNGTYIYMKLSNYSKKEIKEVFDAYADVDGGFTRTSIPLAHIYPNAFPISRSQAKRLTNRFDSFEEIELDFNDIKNIGQGFAHELFVVFNRRNPRIRLTPINANETVQRMIHHVIS